MRFDKGNCRKKRVFSQPDVPTLGEVGEKLAISFGLRLNFRNTRQTLNYALNPNLAKRVLAVVFLTIIYL